MIDAQRVRHVKCSYVFISIRPVALEGRRGDAGANVGLDDRPLLNATNAPPILNAMWARSAASTNVASRSA